MQEQINELEQRISKLEAEKILIDSNPELVKQLLNITKSQLVVTSITNLPVNSPTGTIAMQVVPPKLSFKSDTGWIALI